LNAVALDSFPLKRGKVSGGALDGGCPLLLFKVVKIEGDFVWHHHEDTDEAFLVLEGCMRIDFRDGQVDLSHGEMYMVPRGVEHKPFAENEAQILVIEPRGVRNTGQTEDVLTAQNDIWV
jgi:mannose-6-phosphate isomerase-like protein (cupin superfamily)